MKSGKTIVRTNPWRNDDDDNLTRKKKKYKPSHIHSWIVSCRFWTPIP